ncbi:Uncharacterised protein [Burkholderia pseudomallei]|nr:Uncharacterised protein [Burkholderia pseudomallei]
MNGWSEQAGGPHAASPVLRPAACRARLDGVDTGARCDSGLPSRLARQRVSPRRSAAACTREHGAPGSTATSAIGRNPRVEVPSRGSPRPAARHSKPDSSVLKRPSRNIGPAGSGIENGGPANSMHCPIAGNRRAGQKIAVQSSERRGPPLTRFEFNAQCHCAISVKYENNGDARRECRANLRSRPRRRSRFLCRRLCGKRRNCASRHGKRSKNAFSAKTAVFHSCRPQCGAIRLPPE